MLAALASLAALGRVCQGNLNPLGVVFDFNASEELVNNLGGYAGGAGGLNCTQEPLVGGPSGACGHGCGCRTPEIVAPPGTEQLIRMHAAGTVRRLAPLLVLPG